MRSKPVDQNEEIGFQVRLLSHMIKHTVDQIAFSEVDVTGMHGWIIGYLYENRDKDIFQRDVQARFSISRSTTSGILQVMEKNGFITREPVDWDARLKKLSLTVKALQIHENVIRAIRKTEETLTHMLTEEERETFLMLCKKIRRGIEAQGQKDYPRKEETAND